MLFNIFLIFRSYSSISEVKNAFQLSLIMDFDAAACSNDVICIYGELGCATGVQGDHFTATSVLFCSHRVLSPPRGECC